ncbi:MAG: hypothetical protein GX333_05200 [Syntrophomonadaceae bacterium]|nr:hypothetical protein [Syntrophomonadaceae bacterium]
MKKLNIFIFCILILLFYTSEVLAADHYYDNNWVINCEALTKNWGIRNFSHELRTHEACNYLPNQYFLFYREVNVFWYPKQYAAPELWYNVGVNEKFKDVSGNTLGTIGINDWTSMSWILPIGQKVNGGYNSEDFYFSSLSSKYAVYQTIVDASDLYWPLFTDKQITL